MPNTTTKKLDRLAAQCFDHNLRFGVGYSPYIRIAAEEHFCFIQRQWAADEMLLRCVRLEYDPMGTMFLQAIGRVARRQPGECAKG